MGRGESLTTFRSIDGNHEISEKVSNRVRTITKKDDITGEEIVYFRVPKAKYISRKDRLDTIISSLESLKAGLERIQETLVNIIDEDPEEEVEIGINDRIDMIVDDIYTNIRELDISDFENLKSEMEEWESNMEGTNLENTSKYQEISDCYNSLDNIYLSGLEDIEFSNSENAESINILISDLIESIDSIVSDMSDIEFPNAF